MNNTINDRWNEVCNKVISYQEVDETQFGGLIERIHPQIFNNGFLLITTENSFLKTWVERNYLKSINKALQEIYRIPFNVVIEIDESVSGSGNNFSSDTGSFNAVNNSNNTAAAPSTIENNLQNSSEATQTESDQAVYSQEKPVDQPSQQEISTQKEEAGISINQNNNAGMNLDHPDSNTFTSLTFENFVIGESNRMAYSMAVQVAEFPGKSALNPLFIYGKSGLGKTHLLRAIQNYINETQPDLTTIYADAEELISGYADAAAEQDKDKLGFKNFKTYYENADVLLVDDVQFLQGKKTLDIIFQVFNKLINQGKQIVLSADRAPKNIDIDERYSSRFVQGGTIDIQPPEVETKLAIVKSFIREYKNSEGNLHFDIPDDVQLYIAENSGSNIRELKGAVTILVYNMNFSGQETITVSQVSALLENHFSRGMSRNITISDIQKIVENYYKVKHSDMIGSVRSRDVVYPRQMAMYLCRELLENPLNDIGKKFNRDHTTVIHSVGKIEELMGTNQDVREEIEILKKFVNEL